jgi:hypothetical protein
LPHSGPKRQKGIERCTGCGLCGFARLSLEKTDGKGRRKIEDPIADSHSTPRLPALGGEDP